MKKKINLAKITSFALLLTVTAMILVAGTYAKYSSNASGTDATVIASWSFKVNDEDITILGDDENVTFGLFDTILDSDGSTTETDVAEGLIAPGTSGAFEFALENSSDVTTKYAINLNVDNENVPIEFSFDGTTWTNDLDNLESSDILAIGGTKNVTVQWRWAFGDDTVTDTTLGGQEVIVTANIIATQVDNGDITTETYVEKAIFANATEGLDIASSTRVDSSVAPFSYTNLDLFSGKTLTKIGIPVKTVSALDENQTFTLYVVNKEPLENQQKTTIVNTYTLKLPKSQLGDSTTVNNWVYVDLTDYNITVGDNETLAFGNNSDTVKWGYFRNISADYDFLWKILISYNPSTDNDHMVFDIYYKETASNSETTLETVLEGKNFSILGDSISTYNGYSNDATNTNSTIGSNAVWYTGSNDGITDVNQTWWMQTVNETGMNLLVNNSYSGDKLSEKALDRALQLHDDTGDNANTNPDIIAVYIGINDFNHNGDLTTFETNYDTMISNMLEKYPDADVYLFTHVPNGDNKYNRTDEEFEQFNQIIRDVATKYNCSLVDLYNDSGITADNYTEYCDDSYELHPNQAGMDAITNVFLDALKDNYLN